jgi:hypothetical protein
MRSTILSLITVFSLCISGAHFAYAQDEQEEEKPAAPTPPDITITIDQESEREILGEWTLLMPEKQQEKESTPSHTLYHVKEGRYTIIIDSPSGAVASVHITKNDDLTEMIDRPQASFQLVEGDSIHIKVVYKFTRTGLVVVHSDPSGLEFEMAGPNDTTFKGVTPKNYPDSAEGQYTIQFSNIEGCRVPARKSLLLTKDERISFSIRVECEEAEKIREKQEIFEEGGDKNVTVMIDDGSTVVFDDVPQVSWFATYVFNMAKLGIISGYRDRDGHPTGRYGPGNNVTIAELSKLAHKIGSLDDVNRRPENRRARNQWFSRYFASAEQKGWTIFADGYIDPGRPATRGEVLVTLLQALDVPLQWQKGDIFRDVSTRTPYAAAIETAARDEIVAGHTDEFGSPTGTFGPEDLVNRAEMAKILDKMIETYKKED